MAQRATSRTHENKWTRDKLMLMEAYTRQNKINYAETARRWGINVKHYSAARHHEMKRNGRLRIPPEMMAKPVTLPSTTKALVPVESHEAVQVERVKRSPYKKKAAAKVIDLEIPDASLLPRRKPMALVVGQPDQLQEFMVSLWR